MRSRYLLTLLIGLGMLLLQSCEKPVYNMHNVLVPSDINGRYPTEDQVKQAIFSAAQERGWVPRVIRPGLIEATILVRDHKAVVEIPYTGTDYSIVYKSSENLRYRNGTIHWNYNSWIAKLSKSIQYKLQWLPRNNQ